MKSNLSRLSLVHCNLTDPTFKVLIRFIADNKQLTHLDLSWCERNSADFLDFYEILSENRTI
jgi:tRNA A37 threonylcarbamoyladenosine biosynthesis protein TsaE